MNKLYTEEQVKEMIDDAHNGVDGYYDIFKKHNPIELPSDKEIEKESYKIDYGGGSNGWIQNGFRNGAKWMRDKIKGGNNE